MFQSNPTNRNARKSLAAGLIVLLTGLTLLATGCGESNPTSDWAYYCQWFIDPIGVPCF